MSWNLKRNHRYLYRSVRRGKQVRKVYYGRGPVADIAARMHALHDYEVRTTRELWKQQQQQIEAVIQDTDSFFAGCDELRDAALIAAGYHRLDRHQWRVWRDVRRIHAE